MISGFGRLGQGSIIRFVSRREWLLRYGIFLFLAGRLWGGHGNEEDSQHE